MFKRMPIKLSADFSAETLQARRGWLDIFKVPKGKNIQLRLLYPARISSKTDGVIKSFSDKQKLREFSTTKPSLQQMLKQTYIVKKYKKRKKIYKINPKQLENGNRNIYISNYFKCKWIKYSSQKTQTD